MGILKLIALLLFSTKIFSQTVDADHKLFFGIENNSLAIVQEALKQGAKVDGKNLEGLQPLPMAIEKDNCDPKIVKALVGAHADPFTSREVDAGGYRQYLGSALGEALVKRRSPETIEALLSSTTPIKPEDLNKPAMTYLRTTGNIEFSPINLAAITDRWDSYQLLLSKGAKVKESNIDLSSVIVSSMQQNVSKWLGELISKGANVNRSNLGSPLSKLDSTAGSPLSKAYILYPDLVDTLLKYGALPTDEETLKLVCQNFDEATLQKLISHGLNVKKADVFASLMSIYNDLTGSGFEPFAMKLLNYPGPVSDKDVELFLVGGKNYRSLVLFPKLFERILYKRNVNDLKVPGGEDLAVAIIGGEPPCAVNDYCRNYSQYSLNVILKAGFKNIDNAVLYILEKVNYKEAPELFDLFAQYKLKLKNNDSIIEAMRKGEPGEARALFKLSPNLNDRVTGENNLLSLALRYNQAVINDLLAAGANINFGLPPDSPDGAIGTIVNRGSFLYDNQYPVPGAPILVLFLEKGAPVPNPEIGYEALLYAAAAGSLKGVRLLVEQRRVALTPPSRAGNVSIMNLAVASGNRDLVDYLLQFPQVRNGGGPLISYVHNGSGSDYWRDLEGNAIAQVFAYKTYWRDNPKDMNISPLILHDLLAAQVNPNEDVKTRSYGSGQTNKLLILKPIHLVRDLDYLPELLKYVDINTPDNYGNTLLFHIINDDYNSGFYSELEKDKLPEIMTLMNVYGAKCTGLPTSLLDSAITLHLDKIANFLFSKGCK